MAALMAVPTLSQTVTGFCALNQSIIITGSQVKKEVEHPIYRKYLIEMVMRKGKRRGSYEEEEEEEEEEGKGRNSKE